MIDPEVRAELEKLRQLLDAQSQNVEDLITRTEAATEKRHQTNLAFDRERAAAMEKARKQAFRAGTMAGITAALVSSRWDFNNTTLAKRALEITKSVEEVLKWDEEEREWDEKKIE